MDFKSVVPNFVIRYTFQVLDFITAYVFDWQSKTCIKSKDKVNLNIDGGAKKSMECKKKFPRVNGSHTIYWNHALWIFNSLFHFASPLFHPAPPQECVKTRLLSYCHPPPPPPLVHGFLLWTHSWKKCWGLTSTKCSGYWNIGDRFGQSESFIYEKNINFQTTIYKDFYFSLEKTIFKLFNLKVSYGFNTSKVIFKKKNLKHNINF